MVKDCLANSMAKQRSFVGQVWSDIVQEVREWLVDTPRDLAKQSFWRQIITWPLYIGMVVLASFVVLLALLYLASFIVDLFVAIL